LEYTAEGVSRAYISCCVCIFHTLVFYPVRFAAILRGGFGRGKYVNTAKLVKKTRGYDYCRSA
jgi:hypothetical protein